MPPRLTAHVSLATGPNRVLARRLTPWRLAFRALLALALLLALGAALWSWGPADTGALSLARQPGWSAARMTAFALRCISLCAVTALVWGVARLAVSALLEGSEDADSTRVRRGIAASILGLSPLAAASTSAIAMPLSAGVGTVVAAELIDPYLVSARPTGGDPGESGTATLTPIEATGTTESATATASTTVTTPPAHPTTTSTTTPPTNTPSNGGAPTTAPRTAGDLTPTSPSSPRPSTEFACQDDTWEVDSTTQWFVVAQDQLELSLGRPATAAELSDYLSRCVEQNPGVFVDPGAAEVATPGEVLRFPAIHAEDTERIPETL
jgi:hypothetical protein